MVRTKNHPDIYVICRNPEIKAYHIRIYENPTDIFFNFIDKDNELDGVDLLPPDKCMIPPIVKPLDDVIVLLVSPN